MKIKDSFAVKISTIQEESQVKTSIIFVMATVHLEFGFK